MAGYVVHGQLVRNGLDGHLHERTTQADHVLSNDTIEVNRVLVIRGVCVGTLTLVERIRRIRLVKRLEYGCEIDPGCPPIAGPLNHELRLVYGVVVPCQSQRARARERLSQACRA